MSGAFDSVDENKIVESSESYESTPNPVLKEELLEARDYKVYDYAQYELDRIRDRRDIDFIPLADESSQEKFLAPLYVITAFFAAIMIIGPFLVKRGPNRGIVQACILLAAFSMWIL
ncbi:jg696 [Pararge aegeria aegeria]|uniref:Jg696 protein n=1 Tax=Pararge aegeria aegeria TaxID=348720 RepID=A0A8S4R8P6_9NEOP|nr:jg696 [Pararge aegeria aegeria]